MEGSSFNDGEQIGPYRLTKYLGSDSFGEVWQARRTEGSNAQRVVLKLPFNPDEDQVHEEAPIWKRASEHQNVLPVLEVDTDRYGQIYIASEYIDGGTLTDWLEANEGKAPSLKSAVRIVTDILSGLEYLHAMQPRPIIHGGLKPNNILFEGAVPRITDFGIAPVHRSTSAAKVSSRTPAYMAPEVLSTGDYGVAADLWAVGVIFYQLLTGSLPFPQPDLPSLVHAILMGSAATLPDSLPPTIQPIFTKVFEKEPENRYSSAETMRRDIEGLVDSPPVIPVDIPTVTPTPIETTRRNFLVGIPIVGAAVYGLYALSHSGDSTKGNGGGVPNIFGPSKVGARKINPKDGAETVWISPGSFQMGGNGERDGKPVHTVSLSGYWMYTSPVTVAQFRKFDAVNEKKYNWKDNSPDWGWIDDHPMVRVTWDEASAYAYWAGMALPTEAQWEKAARGGVNGKEYPWGDGWDANRCANSVEPNIMRSTKPVKSYAANGYGLFDMAGNVWEWCSDWYSDDYYKTPAASQKDPICTTEGISHVLRGGSWLLGDQFFFHCGFRLDYLPVDWVYSVGFRCVSPGPSK